MFNNFQKPPNPPKGDFEPVNICFVRFCLFSYLSNLAAQNSSPSGRLGVASYSYLSASTGFLVAAFQLCQLTVNNAIPNASKPASAKIHQLKLVL